MLAEKYSKKAKDAALSGEKEKALAFAGSGYLYGNKEIFNDLNAMMAQGVTFSAFLDMDHDITPLSFSGPVTTTSIKKLTSEVYAPYGVPVYFGDIPRYYISLGEVEVDGMPMYFPIPVDYKEQDAIYELSEEARELGADAIIKVRLWTKRKEYYTTGEMVRFLNWADQHVVDRQPGKDSMPQETELSSNQE